MLPCMLWHEKTSLQRTNPEVVLSILCGHSGEDEGQHDLHLEAFSKFLTLKVGSSRGPFCATKGSAYGKHLEVCHC